VNTTLTFNSIYVRAGFSPARAGIIFRLSIDHLGFFACGGRGEHYPYIYRAHELNAILRLHIFGTRG